MGILCGLVLAHMRSVRMQWSLACSEYEYVNCMWWGLSRLCIKGNSLAHVQAACICSPALLPHPHCTPLLIVPEHSQPPTPPVFPALFYDAQDLTSLHTRGMGLHFPPLVPHSHHPPLPSSLPPLFANTQNLTSLRTKGMGLGSVAGISSLSNLQDVTLTMAEGLGATGWRELGCLTSLTSLNINAWTDVVRGRGGIIFSIGRRECTG